MSKERLEDFRKTLEFIDDSADMEDYQRLMDSLKNLYADGELKWVFRYAKEQAQRVQELENEIERLKDIYYQCKEWGEQQTEKFQEIVGTRIDIEENELDERETIR